MKIYFKINKIMENFTPVPIVEPKNGIPFDMVIGEINEQISDIITCPICQKLIWNVIDCRKCGYTFCKKCIEESLEKVNDSCPICRDSPFKTTYSQTTKRLLANIRIKCPNVPCEENPEYFDYISHQEKCKFRKYRCINDGCNFEITLDNKSSMEYHSKSCQYRIIKCEYCNKKIKFNDVIEHANKYCNQIIECNTCHMKMTRSTYMSKHDDICCLKGLVKYYVDKNKIKNKKFTTIFNNSIDKLKDDYVTQIAEKEKEYINLLEKNKILQNEKERLEEELSKLNDTNNLKNSQDITLLNKKRERTDCKKE